MFFSEEFETVMHTNDTIAPVGYINFKKFCLLKKPVGKILNLSYYLVFDNKISNNLDVKY